MLYAISARVTRHVDGYTSTIELPTHYLDSDVQGITSTDHARRIITSALVSLGHAIEDVNVIAVDTWAPVFNAAPYAELKSRGRVDSSVPRSADADMTHPIFGAIPPIQAPALDMDVIACAQRIAADFLSRADLRGESDVIRGDSETRGTQFLYRLVRDSMGRRAVAIIDGTAPYPLDDEAISEGIVRALNASKSTAVAGVER